MLSRGYPFKDKNCDDRIFSKSRFFSQKIPLDFLSFIFCAFPRCNSIWDRNIDFIPFLIGNLTFLVFLFLTHRYTGIHNIHNEKERVTIWCWFIHAMCVNMGQRHREKFLHCSTWDAIHVSCLFYCPVLAIFTRIFASWRGWFCAFILHLGWPTNK